MNERSAVASLAAFLALAACGRRADPAEELDDKPAQPAAPSPRQPERADRFPELADLPRTRALRILELPARIDVPRFDVHGPLLLPGEPDLALVATSQLGFYAVNWRTGKPAWVRPAGAHLAPPVGLPTGEVVLLGDCAIAPELEEPVLGCARVVSAAGSDRSDGAIVGPAALAERMAGPGPQRTWALDERRVAWQRGEHTLTLELPAGRVRAGAPPPPPALVRHGALELAITLDPEGQLRAHRAGGRGELVWQGQADFSALLAVIPARGHDSPMLRLARPSSVRSVGESSSGAAFDVLDVDAMTGTGAQAATPAPGIQILAAASGPHQSAAMVVRLDRSLRRDYVIAYTSTARVAWVYPLPEALRPDPVGLAIAAEAVLVFHDGDTLSVLPPIE